jgi:predicted RNA methylase
MNQYKDTIKKKIRRLHSGQPPRVMDIFGGCGGITLGFVTAGFEPVASVEIDAWARLCNFFRCKFGPGVALAAA